MSSDGCNKPGNHVHVGQGGGIGEREVARVMAWLLRNEQVSPEAMERAVGSAMDMGLGEPVSLHGENQPFRRAFVEEQLGRLRRPKRHSMLADFGLPPLCMPGQEPEPECDTRLWPGGNVGDAGRTMSTEPTDSAPLTDYRWAFDEIERLTAERDEALKDAERTHHRLYVVRTMLDDLERSARTP